MRSSLRKAIPPGTCDKIAPLSVRFVVTFYCRFLCQDFQPSSNLQGLSIWGVPCRGKIRCLKKQISTRGWGSRQIVDISAEKPAVLEEKPGAARHPARSLSPSRRRTSVTVDKDSSSDDDNDTDSCLCASGMLLLITFSLYRLHRS